MIQMPCLKPIFVPTHKVVANDYNPNQVPHERLEFLKVSLQENGLTQAPVVFYDQEQDLYIVIDGFHRYRLLRDWFKCNYIPVVVVDLPFAQRMAATVAHNRFRGKHQAELTQRLVLKLTAMGWKDVRIARKLGMRAEEVLRYKQAGGIAEYYAHRQYSRAWIWVDVPDEDDVEIESEENGRE